MKMKNFGKHLGLCMLFCGFLLSPEMTTATHIRAGEIIARRVDSQSLTYEITIRGYTDRNSQVIFGSNGTLDFGDGTAMTLTNNSDPNSTDYIPRTAVSEDTWMYELTINHTYPAARSYTVSFSEFYRNEGILNMNNSVNMPFYVETAIVIDPFFGMNNTPELRTAPIDQALRGKTYHHQPAGFDADGDSLSYRMVIPGQNKNTAVDQYRYPHITFPASDLRNGSSEAGGETFFSINPISGDITWDAPGSVGEYNIAFQVVEWRKINGTYYQLGFVTRDMQIIVSEGKENGLPQLLYPFTSGNISPAAGETLSWTITATAPSPEDSVVLELWGDFPLRTDAIISNRMVRAKGEATITIQWVGEEDRGQHYQLIARSYDPSSPHLARSRSTFVYYNAADPLGIRDLPLAELKVFPNPVMGQRFSISLPVQVTKESFLQIYDIKGRLILQENVPAATEEMPVLLPNAGKGIYLLLLHHNNRIYRNKLIVQ